MENIEAAITVTRADKGVWINITMEGTTTSIRLTHVDAVRFVTNVLKTLGA